MTLDDIFNIPENLKKDYIVIEVSAHTTSYEPVIMPPIKYML